LHDFYAIHPDAEGPIRSWLRVARNAEWRTMHDVKQQFGNASIIGNNRVVFNIKGNDYRLVVKIDFEWSALYIRFIGIHQEYDKINANTI
jgi:mRNA interferase HigB